MAEIADGATATLPPRSLLQSAGKSYVATNSSQLSGDNQTPVRRVPQIAARRAQLRQGAISTLGAVQQTPAGINATNRDPDSQPFRAALPDSPIMRTDEKTASINTQAQFELYELQKQIAHLRADLSRSDNVRSSVACQDLISFVMNTFDPMVPSVHGRASDADEMLGESSGCCTIA